VLRFRLMVKTRSAYAASLKFDRIEVVPDDMRELIEAVWPELAHKLPPKEPNGSP
jgi:hypothetical protein